MLDALRDRVARYLAAQQTAVLTPTEMAQPCSLPVRCQARGLQLDCLLPRWSEAASQVAQGTRVALVLLDPTSEGRCWLHYLGVAASLPSPDWNSLLPTWHSPSAPEDLYLAIRVSPERIDLIDERRGWGARETVE